MRGSSCEVTEVQVPVKIFGHFFLRGSPSGALKGGDSYQGIAFSDAVVPELKQTRLEALRQSEGQRLKAAFVSVVCGMPEGIP
jgi:hypothetical protein